MPICGILGAFWGVLGVFLKNHTKNLHLKLTDGFLDEKTDGF